MAKQSSGKIAIGIFNEGNILQVVKLLKYRKTVKLLDAEIIRLSATQSGDEEEQLEKERDVAELRELTSLESDADTPNFQEMGLDDDLGITDEISVLTSAISGHSAKTTSLAISIAEPDFYYSNFTADFGLTGQKLDKRILTELMEERGEVISKRTNRIGMFPLANDSLQVIVRDDDIRIFDLLHKVRTFTHRRTPPIEFVESLELSLVNLVRENYVLPDEEVSAIIYVGYNHSRFLFMKGKEIFHISQIIADGFNADSINRTIYSRLLFEQDNLGLANIDNIFLAGKARETGVKNYMLKWKSESVKIEEISYEKLDISDVDNRALNVLPEVAVALGAAWRAVETTNRDLTSIDLTPTYVKEEQKAFKLGVSGWLMFLIAPLLAFYFTVRIFSLDQHYKDIGTQLQQKQELLQYYEDLKEMLEKEIANLGTYESSILILDNMLVGTETHSTFLQDLWNLTQRVGKIWITDITANIDNVYVIQGYSLYRSNVSSLVNRLEGAVLIRVDEQTIREGTVFQFEIKVTAPTK